MRKEGFKWEFGVSQTKYQLQECDGKVYQRAKQRDDV